MGPVVLDHVLLPVYFCELLADVEEIFPLTSCRLPWVVAFVVGSACLVAIWFWFSRGPSFCVGPSIFFPFSFLWLLPVVGWLSFHLFVCFLLPLVRGVSSRWFLFVRLLRFPCGVQSGHVGAFLDGGDFSPFAFLWLTSFFRSPDWCGFFLGFPLLVGF